VGQALPARSPRTTSTTGTHQLQLRSAPARSDGWSLDAAGAIERFREATADWRQALLTVDETDYDRTGLSTYPYGSDSEETFPAMVWWANHEILHHGAEIALLHVLYVHRNK
jgi:hypothetical protein